ncbi:amino acid adenylation domain-containing protein [Clostridium sp. CF011]|uniref:non-ribosomal peptide synthetase n=1 Tax=Clostridium sp. CF011 TaxID=2843318 RepID=UPI001C0D0D82|nr:non-ribosomal peptide synthetase [Clostridium sp. CF011]MBU3093335.1 amino acid adenylation domain-containing protein [Clostridium sp. CF011]WAG70791.1 amino acid adenylation domain-containing protein [Clostridium sp. CF011]
MVKKQLNEEEIQIYPLSLYQKDVWVEQCLYKDKPIYNIGGYANINGPIEYQMFQKSVQKLIEDNDSLRIRIFENDGQPSQKILKELKYEVPFYDFSIKEYAEKFSLNWMQKEFLKPFIFDNGENLFRFVLIKVNNNKYFYFMESHHIVSDGWGFSLIFKETVNNYNNITETKSKLEKYSYLEFIKENKRYQESDTYLKNKMFWKDKFKHIPEALFTKGVNSNGGIVSNRESLVIERKVYDEIIEFSNKRKCSVFHFFLGILAVYFGEVCNKEEVVIGVPILNRTKASNKQIVGHFANVIPLKIAIIKEKTFSYMINEIRMELGECYRHQKLSFGEICGSIYKERKDGLFDITLSYEHHNYAANFNGAKTDIKTLSNHHERNSMSVFIREFDECKDVEINFDYNIEVFKKFMPIKDVITHIQYLIKHIIDSDEKSINDIEIITEQEKHQILCDFNDTKAEYQKYKTIYELFEEQVEKTPDNIAVVFEDEKLTYRELNEKANCLARILREKGVKPDSVVGIMIESSPEMIVGILAILKAGGAYLPIEPSYPQERIKYILENSKSSILITKSAYMDLFNIEVEIIDIDNTEIYNTDKENLGKVNIPQDLAYIIYTSGSTGKPKGVVITHEAVLNTIQDINSKFAVKENDKIIGLSSVCFDLSVYDIFGALSTGAKLVQIKDQRDVNKIIEVLKDKSITIWNSVPAIMDMLIESITEPFKNENLRLVMLSGDWIPLKLPGKIKKYFPNAAIISLGGATEASIWSIYYPVTEVKIGWNSIPYGMPLSNQSFYVLNKEMKLCPFGIPGKLYIGGIGLAKGYMNDIEKTKNAFINHPEFGKLYSTGDWGRFRKEGYIEFLGRRDHQVKIRGFRIELGEIENQLLRQENIKEAVVVDREDKKGNKYLCAYIVFKKEMTLSELRESLSKELPDYMIPSYFIQIEKLPLTPNGKVDRKSLPEPDGEISTGVEYAVPRNEIEEKMVKVWSEVLGVKKVGIDDSFFELGGDSIKAIQVCARLSRYNLKITVSELFANPTIRELSINAKQEDKQINQKVIQGEVELTAIQRWFFKQEFTNMHHWNQAFMMYSKECFDEKIIDKVFSKIVEHHDALRIVIRKEENKLIQYNRRVEDKLFDLSVMDLGNKESYQAEMEEQATKIQSSINLIDGPLVKLGLFKTKDGDHLLIVIHHLVVDGISWRVLLEDFSAGYRCAVNKEKIELPIKTHSFKEWSENIQKYAKSNKLLEEIEYWKNVEDTEVIKLPKDHQTTSNNWYSSKKVQMKISKEETDKLLTDTNRAYNTEINDILLAALGLSIKNWTGENKVLVSIEGHGREEIIPNMNITRTIGWFTSSYPVILDCEKSEDINYYIKSTKDGIRRIPNKGVGYNILKYVTLNEYIKDLEFKQNPQISFNYLGQFDNDVNQEMFNASFIPTGDAIGKECQRLYDIDINGMVVKGELCLNFEYNKDEYDESTIIELVKNYKEALLDIIKYCVEKEETEMTPSDLDYKEVSIEELQDIKLTIGSLFNEI